MLPRGATRYYSLGRWALVDALRAGDVGAGDRVLVPELICREVLASVRTVGATPIFYRVAPDLSADIGVPAAPSAKAVLAVNYFGFPQCLDVFRDYCSRTGATLIEDNAHGFLSRDATGRLLGSRGDAGIFSFRKTIAVPDGAAVVLNGHRRLPDGSSSRPARDISVRYRAKQAFRRVAPYLGPCWTDRTIGLLRHLRRLGTGSALPASPTDAESRIPIAPHPNTWISRTMHVADPDLEAQRRRALHALAARVVAGTGAVPVFASLPPYVVPYGYPVFVPPAHLSEVVRETSRHGFQLSRWPDLPEAVVPSAPDHYRQLMVLPFLW